MQMDKVAGSHNDEFYTPKYAIVPIMKYLDKFNKVWCPFDTKESNFVKMLSNSHQVVATHIQNGQDFFEMSLPDGCDVIVSNPPYTLKGQVLGRLFSLHIPFAMLVGVVGLFESKTRFAMFRENDFEIMYLNKRVSFLKDYGDEHPKLNPPFSSVYVCSGVLPKQIVFEEIDKRGK